MRRGVLLLAVLLHGSAFAFDSRCYYPGPAVIECTPGPDAARNRWIGPSDEHRQLWELTSTLARLPASVLGTTTLVVFTDDSPIALGGPASLRPVGFFDARLAQERLFSPDEFAELPDHGYALWDWAMGFETCPLAPPLATSTSAEACHEFKTHMGPVNSNHFPPQTRRDYLHYHALALDRAGTCQAMQARIQSRGGDPALFQGFLRDCETEALLLEAIAQHFLQDAWSSGHMWERWGSAELTDFPDLSHAILVAMTAGLIHGARAVLQEEVAWAGFDVNDAMCAPAPAVTWRTPSAAGPEPGVGDLYAAQLTASGGAAFPATFRQLFSCGASSLRAVYAAAGQQHGVFVGPLAPGLVSLDPASDDCFGARSTNRALQQGMALDYTDPGGVQHRLPLDPFVGTLIVPALGGLGAGAALTPTLVAQYGLDLVDITAMTLIGAALAPDDTTLADGGLPDLLGMRRNSDYVGSPASYVDPALPWPGAGTDDHAVAVARTFHRAHATDWCNRFRPGEPTFLDVEALRSKVDTLQQAGIGGTALSTACAACVEFTRRHLRVGADASAYDRTREPLCVYVADDPAAAQIVYQEGTALDALTTLASARCGCGTTTTTTIPTPTTTTLPSIVLVGASSHDLAAQAGTNPPVRDEGGGFSGSVGAGEGSGTISATLMNGPSGMTIDGEIEFVSTDDAAAIGGSRQFFTLTRTLPYFWTGRSSGTGCGAGAFAGFLLTDANFTLSGGPIGVPGAMGGSGELPPGTYQFSISGEGQCPGTTHLEFHFEVG